MKKISYSWRGVVLDGGYFNKILGKYFFCFNMCACLYVWIYVWCVSVSTCGDQSTTSGITPQKPFIHLVLSDIGSSAGLKLTKGIRLAGQEF